VHQRDRCRRVAETALRQRRFGGPLPFFSEPTDFSVGVDPAGNSWYGHFSHASVGGRFRFMKHLGKPCLAAAVAVLLAAGCGPVAGHRAHRAAAPPVMTSAEGGEICSDVAAWLPGAENRDRPRFTAMLLADVTKARGSELGLDLAGLDSDLLDENSVALMPGPPGDPQNIQLVRSDCRQYGVTVPGS
jgi:hypothetical protein